MVAIGFGVESESMGIAHEAYQQLVHFRRGQWQRLRPCQHHAARRPHEAQRRELIEE